jgi:hypothetical protein
VTPPTATFSAGQSQLFTATVAYADNTQVTWSITSGLGSIDSTGLYTAPNPIAAQQTVTITATSQADPTKSGSATVTLIPPPPAIMSVVPGQAQVGVSEALTITAANTGFVQGQTQLDLGSSVAVSNVTVISPMQLTATILPALSAAPGQLTLTVTTGSSSVSLANAITITGPTVMITSPTNLSFVNTPTITVSGQVGDPTAVVTVNGIETPNSSGNFSMGVPLSEGNNTVTVTARSAGWATTTAVVQVNLDTTPPHLAIVSPPSGMQTADASITVSGMVNDIVVGTVNSQQATVTVNGVAATVLNRSFTAVVPLTVGQNTIQVIALDRVGNMATASVLVQRVASSRVSIVSGNNQSGPVLSPLPSPLVVVVTDATGAPATNRPVVFTVAGNNGLVSAVSASGVGKQAIQVTTDSNGQAQVYWILGSHAGAGNNRVEVSSPGTEGWVYFSASGVPASPANIVVDSGLNQTGAAGEVFPLPFVAVVIDAGNNRLANVPVTFTVTQGGGTLGGAAAQLNSAAGAHLSNVRDGRPLRTAPVMKPRDSTGTSVTMMTDGDGRAAVFLQAGPGEGRGNNVVQATFAENAGFPAVFTATGLVAGNPAQTSVSGVVLDNSSVPIPGVTMRLLGLSQGTNGNVPVEVIPSVQTDSQGQFTMTQAPVGVFKLMADGTTAQIPGEQFPTLEFDVTTVAGRNTTVGMPMYLKALDTVNQLCVTATTGGTLTLPASPGFSLTIAPGSATFPGGSRSGCITATPVNMDKVPMAPGFGQQPRFILTIQPVGTTFNPPAAITIPNVDGLAPREVTELYSYDHDLAAFVAIGTGTVSADGSVISSDPGVGVLKAGWHCGGNPNPTGTSADCPDCQTCNGTSCATDASQNGKKCQGDPCKRCKDGSCNPLTLTSITVNNTSTPGAGTSFLAERAFDADPTGDVIQAQANSDPPGDLSDVQWTVTATIGDITQENPASYQGPTFSFVPDPGDHPPYGQGGSPNASSPLSYTIQASICGQTQSQTITQDTIDVIRQEYVNHGITVPARTDFNTIVGTTHFSASNLNTTAYAPIGLGDPGSLAEAVRAQFNTLLNGDQQVVPVGTANLLPTAPVVQASTISMVNVGRVLFTPPCNPNPPKSCDDVVSPDGTQILAGKDGIAQTAALTGDFGLNISSGWRNPERQEWTGSTAINSRHQYGNAIDMEPVWSQIPAGVTQAQVWCTLLTAAQAVGQMAQAESGPAKPTPCNSGKVNHVHVQR